MQQSMDTLQTKLKIIEQFEKFFKINNIQEFKQQLEKETKDTFSHFMQGKASAITQAAFGQLSFPANDARSVYVSESIELLNSLIVPTKDLAQSLAEANNLQSPNRAFCFFTLVISAVLQSERKVDGFFELATEFIISNLSQSPARNQHSLLNQLIYKVNHLIALQKAEVQQKLQEELAKESNHEAQLILAEQKIQSRNKFIRYTNSAVLFTAGSVITGVSAVLYYHPQLILAASLHLPPVALAALAVTGITMMIAGLALAYRTYFPKVPSTTPAPTETGYSRSLTAAYCALGVGLPSLAALVHFAPELAQFSPKFALLMSVHVPPALLIAASLIGVLLLSVALYRACKISTPVPAEVAPSNTNPSCLQRVYKSLCGFNLFGASVNASVETATINLFQTQAPAK